MQTRPAAGGEPAAGLHSTDRRPALPVPVAEERSMPIPESNPAAALSFDAAVNRALARRRADIPLPPRPDASEWDGPVRPQAAAAGPARDPAPAPAEAETEAAG